jgi:hypothetical protein
MIHLPQDAADVETPAVVPVQDLPEAPARVRANKRPFGDISQPEETEDSSDADDREGLMVVGE